MRTRSAARCQAAPVEFLGTALPGVDNARRERGGLDAEFDALGIVVWGKPSMPNFDAA